MLQQSAGPVEPCGGPAAGFEARRHRCLSCPDSAIGRRPPHRCLDIAAVHTRGIDPDHGRRILGQNHRHAVPPPTSLVSPEVSRSRGGQASTRSRHGDQHRCGQYELGFRDVRAAPERVAQPTPEDRTEWHRAPLFDYLPTVSRFCYRTEGPNGWPACAVHAGSAGAGPFPLTRPRAARHDGWVGRHAGPQRGGHHERHRWILTAEAGPRVPARRCRHRRPRPGTGTGTASGPAAGITGPCPGEPPEPGDRRVGRVPG